MDQYESLDFHQGRSSWKNTNLFFRLIMSAMSVVNYFCTFSGNNIIPCWRRYFVQLHNVPFLIKCSCKVDIYSGCLHWAECNLSVDSLIHGTIDLHCAGQFDMHSDINDNGTQSKIDWKHSLGVPQSHSQVAKSLFNTWGVPNQFSFWEYWVRNDTYHVQFHVWCLDFLNRVLLDGMNWELHLHMVQM